MRPIPELRNVNRQHGRAGLAAVVAVAVLAGVAFGWWYVREPRPQTGMEAPGEALPVLSGSTVATLKGLRSPVEIRFYSLLDPTSVSESVRNFAGRAAQLLAGYQREGAGQVKVILHESASDPAAAAAAAADGIKPFNISVGDACYLGISVVQGDRKESIPQLSPDWEPALEADVTRAILRVSAAGPNAAVPAPEIPADPQAIKEVLRAIPDVRSVSLEDGRRMLREAALKEFKTVAAEMAPKLQQAEQRVIEAQNGKPEAEQETARKDLQQIRAAQAERIKAIAVRAQSQVEAFEDLKRSQQDAPQ